jgi:hypothetical protein
VGQYTEDIALSERPRTAPLFVAGKRWAWQAGAVTLLLLVLALLTWSGISYRRWAWDFTAVARFRGDIHRNFTFGEAALEKGYLNIHENQLRDNPPRGKKLDYPPLRLLTFEAWAAWIHHTHPGQQWNETYAFHAPLMRYYTLLVWLAAIAAFGIVWCWRLRCAQADNVALDAPPPSPWTGVIPAVAAFALLWFDPGVNIIGHGWPSPNIWVLPFYLWTVLLCLWDRWFIAGLVLAVGTMMQGQLLSVVAIFLLWPVFAGQWLRLLHWTCGYALGFMAVVSPWMLSIRPDIQADARFIHWSAVGWVVVTLALVVMVGLRQNLHRRIDWRWFLIPAAAAATAIILPAARTLSTPSLLLVSLATLGLIVAIWFADWSIKRYLIPLVLAGCLLACIPFFHASTGWWQVGFLYGAERFPHVASDITSNLSTLLNEFFGWKKITDHAMQIPKALLLGWPAEPINLTVRQFLATLFAVLLAINAFFIARHWRQRRLNLLVALVLPWVLFFTVMPQMSPRYTVFIAGVGALCIGYGFGMTLLTWFFSALTVVQTGYCMMAAYRRPIRRHPNWLFNPETFRSFHTIIPNLAWAEVLVCLIFIYVAFSVTRRRKSTPGRVVPLPP